MMGLALSALSTSSLIRHQTPIFLLLRLMSLLHIYFNFPLSIGYTFCAGGEETFWLDFISQYCNDDKSNGHVSHRRRIRVMAFNEVLFILTKYSGFMWADVAFRGQLVSRGSQTKPKTHKHKSHFTYKQNICICINTHLNHWGRSFFEKSFLLANATFILSKMQ